MTSNRSLLIEAVWVSMALLLAVPAHADRPAKDHATTHLGVRPRDMLALTGAVAAAASTHLTRVGAGGEFTVPSGQVFVLTDLIVSPQVFPAAGDYAIAVSPSPDSFTTFLAVTCSAVNPACFQVKLTSGMVFQAHSVVRVSLGANSGSPVNISAFGYLMPH